MNESTSAPTRNDTWTTDTYAAHNEALRDAEGRLQEMRDKFFEERDRRYQEVNIEREKALKIKETADLAALGLAREIQTYKDEKANELREQISSERGNYATKQDVIAATEKTEETIKPLAAYVQSQTGRQVGVTATTGLVIALAGILVALVIGFLNHRSSPQPTPTTTVTVPTK